MTNEGQDRPRNEISAPGGRGSVSAVSCSRREHRVIDQARCQDALRGRRPPGRRFPCRFASFDRSPDPARRRADAVSTATRSRATPIAPPSIPPGPDSRCRATRPRNWISASFSSGTWPRSAVNSPHSGWIGICRRVPSPPRRRPRTLRWKDATAAGCRRRIACGAFATWIDPIHGPGCPSGRSTSWQAMRTRSRSWRR